MTRLSKVLIAAAATIAVPVQVAMAQDDAAPAESEAVPPPEDATGTPPEGMPADAPATGVGGIMTPSIISRSLVLPKGKLAFQADVIIAHTSQTVGTVTSSSTSELLGIGAGYGVTDKITAGGLYAFALNEFEIKGPLTVYGSYSLTDNGTLAVAAGADLVADLNGQTFDSMGVAESRVELSIHAGLAVRYKLGAKMAVFSGNPYTPGPAGQHLSLGLSEGEAKSFSLPVGFAYQATPQLYITAETVLFKLLLSDPGMGDRAAFIFTDAGGIPLSVSGWFNINKNIDAGASFIFPDLKNAGDAYAITVGGRYFM